MQVARLTPKVEPSAKTLEKPLEKRQWNAPKEKHDLYTKEKHGDNKKNEERRQEWKNVSTKEGGRCGHRQDKHQAKLKKQNENISIQMMEPEMR